MLDKINYKGIFYSFFLGGFIGLVLQLIYIKEADFVSFSLAIVISCFLGLVIGALTEIISAFIPVKKVTMKTYFLYNNLIAITITTLVFLILLSLYPMDDLNSAIVIAIIISIVTLANIGDYLRYKRSNKKLDAYKNRNH